MPFGIYPVRHFLRSSSRRRNDFNLCLYGWDDFTGLHKRRFKPVRFGLFMPDRSDAVYGTDKLKFPVMSDGIYVGWFYLYGYADRHAHLSERLYLI